MVVKPPVLTNPWPKICTGKKQGEPVNATDRLVSQNALACVLRVVEELLEALVVLGHLDLDVLPADLVGVVLRTLMMHACMRQQRSQP